MVVDSKIEGIGRELVENADQIAKREGRRECGGRGIGVGEGSMPDEIGVAL